MAENALYDLTCGPMSATSERAIASVQNYGFSQSVFTARSAAVAGAVSVPRPSARQAAYPAIKPGDRVSCPGLGRDAACGPGLYRVRRMAEGRNRATLVEHTQK